MKPNEQEAVKALFEKLMLAPLRAFPGRYGELDAPVLQGVYVIYDPQGRDVLHVGSTPRAKGGIAQRLRKHMGHKSGKSSSSSFVRLYEPLEGDGSRLRRDKYTFRCLPVDDPRRRSLLEAYAIGHLCPAHLGTGRS